MITDVQNSMFWESGKANNLTYNKYYYQLLNIATSLFKWENLPPSIDERFLELQLCCFGTCLFAYDESLVVNNDDSGLIATRWNYQGKLNIYGIPELRHAYAPWTGYTKNFDSTNSVIVWDNRVRNRTIDVIKFFTEKLWNMDRTIDVNLRAQKTPVLIETDKEGKMTLLNVYKSFDGNMPVIFAKKNSNISNQLNVLKTDAPYVSDKIYNMLKMRWNECLSDLGVPNMNVGKKERLVQDEVKTSQGDTNMILEEKLFMRHQACNEINRVFSGKLPNGEISVDVNERLLNMLKDSEPPIGGDESE